MPRSAPAPAPAPVAERPVLSGALATVHLPAKDPVLGWMTINRGIGPEQTIWQFRAALNVAALVCRGPEDAGLAEAYNAMLKAHKARLNTANLAVVAKDHVRFGADATAAHDAYMTRLYNFWAQPEGKQGFCTAAVPLASEAATLDDARFADFAKAHLADLEAPFLHVYDDVAAIRAGMEAWDAAHPASGSGSAPVSAAASSD